jgi:hypothetical protein
MRNLRWLVTALCVTALIAVFAAFDSFGAGCGDAINKDGSQSFECNTAAYLVMAAGCVALARLVGMVVWAVIDRVVARRNGQVGLAARRR